MNYWFLFSQVVYDAMEAINDGVPHANSLINSGLQKFMGVDGLTVTHLFRSIDRAGTTWYMASVYDLTDAEIQAFMSEWPNDIEQGGQWEFATGAQIGPLNPRAVEHMPEECIHRDADGLCDTWQPAASVHDVNLLAGQAPRDFRE